MAEVLHTLKAFESLKRIDVEDWRKVASPHFPFTDYPYLRGLEESGAVTTQTGWIPHHLTLWKEKELAGASFLYEKNHSYGEYIFDWAWAEAYAQHQTPYFPKLVSSIPFTPATGPKLLLSPTCDKDTVARQLLSAAKEKMKESKASSLHYLFLQPDEIPYFEREGFLIRNSFQYHWRNRGYESFLDFLEHLKPRKRKQILKERRDIQEQNIHISVLRGTDLLQSHALLFHSFYRSTIAKMGAIEYLSPVFFEGIFHTMKDQIVLILAELNGKTIAGALFFEKAENLYGRYWGSSQEIRNLHFELCYYQPLEYAIKKGLKIFEAGAQGEHKIARGFVPELTYSAHWIQHPLFREAIQRFILEEKAGIDTFFESLNTHTPYRSQEQGRSL